MKITKDRLVFIIKEEHQKVKTINEVMNSAEYQRLVEIVGKERADVIVEGFFDFDWIPGSSANKMKKVIDALEAVEGDADQINAILDQLPDDGTEFVQAVNNAAESSSDPAAQDAVEDLAAATDNSPDTKPDDDQETADTKPDGDQETADTNSDPAEIKSDDQEAALLRRIYADDIKAAGLSPSAMKAVAHYVEDYLIDYFKARKITDIGKIYTGAKELKPEMAIANANKLKPGEKFGKTTKDGKKIIYTITGSPESGFIPVETTQDGEKTPKVALSIKSIPNLKRLTERIIKEELEKILKGN